MKANWLSLTALPLFLAAVACEAKEGKAVYQQVDPLVVCIESHFDRGTPRMGTGFFVAPRVIATVSHEVVAATRIVVHLPDKSTQTATTLAVVRASDISLLSIPSAHSDYLPLEGGGAGLGEEVFTIGCPFGVEHSLTQGVVSHPSRIVDGRRLIQTNLVVNLGNSGGPLLNKDGKVLGLIYGYLKGTSGINFAVPIDTVISLMRQSGINVDLLATPEIYQLWSKAQATEDPATQISLYHQITEKVPWLAEAFYNQGLAHYRSGQFSQAQQSYEIAVAKRASYYQAYTNLGLALYQLGQYAKARDAIVKAIAIKPDYALAYLNLGIVYKNGLRDEQSAQRAFQRFLELSPESAEAIQVRKWLQGTDAPAQR